MIGEIVRVVVDRPLGSCHPQWTELWYPLNYGYVPGIMAPDGYLFSWEEIRRQAWFQERFFDSEIWMGEDPE